MTIEIYKRMKSPCIVSHRMYKEHLSRLGFTLLGVASVRYIYGDDFKEEPFSYSYDDLDMNVNTQQLTEGENPVLAHIDNVTAVSFIIRLASGQYVHTGMIELYKAFPAAGMAFTTSPANAFREAAAKMTSGWKHLPDVATD